MEKFNDSTLILLTYKYKSFLHEQVGNSHDKNVKKVHKHYKRKHYFHPNTTYSYYQKYQTNISLPNDKVVRNL